jgi:hypothetical protein
VFAAVKNSTISVAVLAPLLIVGMGTLLSDAASANQCAARCYAQENDCRRATRGSPSCEAELTRCLQACRAQR